MPKSAANMCGQDASLAWRMFNLNWLPIGLLGIALSCALAWTDFSLEPIAFGVMVAIGLTLALIVYVYAFIRAGAADPKLIFWLGATAQAVVVTAIVGPLSYVANALNWPLQDQTLLLIDRAMGLDPEWIAAFVNNHGWLANALNVGYGFIKWPLLGVPIVLSMTLRLIRLQQFILALTIALAVTIVVSVFVPAIGTYYALDLSPTARFPLVNSSYYLAQLRDILALRDGSLRHLELFKLAGIVSFPSFHAASAVLYVWALWPVRGFRWATIGVNAWMMAATPVLGAHYIIDIVGGAVVAAAAIALAKYLFRIPAAQSTAYRGFPGAAVPSIWKYRYSLTAVIGIASGSPEQVTPFNVRRIATRRLSLAKAFYRADKPVSSGRQETNGGRSLVHRGLT